MKNYYFLRVNQNIDFEMYIGKINILDLFDLHDVKPLTEDADDLSEDQITKDYLNRGLVAQRGEKQDRIKDIALYISTGNIPNSIILGNIKGNVGIHFKETEGDFYKLIVENTLTDENKLFVIDGQHRLKGVALYTYEKILNIIITTVSTGNLENKGKLLDELYKITAERNYLNKITKIKSLSQNEDLGLLYNKVLLEINPIEFSIVILNNISNNKIVEVFTDINTLVKPLDSNINRYYYGRFTTKFPYLNISVNIAKLLNENETSPLCGLIKMPYKSKYDKGLSKVGIGAFCERFNGVSELKGLSKDIGKIDFFKRPLGIIINHSILLKSYGSIISDEKIIEVIKFLFLFFAYSYKEIKDLYYEYLEERNINEGSKEYKQYKFIDSTTNELYFAVIKYLLIFSIIEMNYNIDKILTLDKNEIEKSIKLGFLKLKDSLAQIYIQNNHFMKGKTDGTGWAKSGKIVKDFEKLVLLATNIDKRQFNHLIVGFYKR